MHTLVTVIGFLVIALVWWLRLNDARNASGEVAKKSGVLRGNLRRDALRKLAGMSAISAIEKPLIAAATLLFSTQSEEFVLGDGDEEIIEKLLLELADKESVSEAMDYARWAITQSRDPNLVIDKLGSLLKKKLTDNEKHRFLDMLREANVEIGGCYDFDSTSVRLARKMGLETTR